LSAKLDTPSERAVQEVRAALRTRLQKRAPEIEEALLTRVYALADPDDLDPAYAEGLRGAVSAAIEYGLASIELGEEHVPPPPPALLLQARLAARHGVGLDIVLRRYCAGHALLGDFLVGEARQDDLLAGPLLQRLLRAQGARFDRLIAAVTEEYRREESTPAASPGRRRAELIGRLLDGELVDTAELAYDLGAHHLGAVASGSGAEAAIRELAEKLDRRLLLIRPEQEMVWAWLGGRRQIDPAEIQRCLQERTPAELRLAIGEPGKGLAGWRLSHRQAAAALPIALRSSQTFVRYADVALLASILQDELLSTSLRRLYLEPLEGGRDGGEALRETLRAYFAAERNVSSAAAALGVSRQAIGNRLRVIEERLDRRVGACATELEIALHVEDLGVRSDSPRSPLREAELVTLTSAHRRAMSD
jgi:hypothetical protein